MRYQGFVPTYQKLVADQLKIQRQIASGKRILAPSDDTAGASRSQTYNHIISILDQNMRNVEEATNWSRTTETAVNSTVNYVQRAQELAVQAGDFTLSDSARQGIAQELEQIIQGVIEAAGIRHRGHAVFSGSRTDESAFSAVYGAGGEVTGVNYEGNGEDRTTEISPGRNATYNILGSNQNGGQFGIFRDNTRGIDIFNTLIDLRDNVIANDQTALSTISTPQLTDGLAHLTEGLARLGGVQTRMLLANNIDEDLTVITTDALSKASDTDVAAAATQFAQLEAAYKAALATGSRMMNLSLVDYLG
jgi:flagellar hook-associated protein 3 FlgL